MSRTFLSLSDLYVEQARNKKSVIIYKRHQIVITELEIVAVGTDILRRTSWWAREDLGKARTWKSIKNMHFSEMYTNAKNDPTSIKIMYCWMKLGAS
jgi:hypothetical protein